MTDIVISGTGLYTPEQSISNEELVESFNTYVDSYNAENAEAIAAGELPPLQPSSAEFIAKASGIQSRYVMDKEGILDPLRMVPRIPDRPNEAQSVQCGMAVAAATEAMEQAAKRAADIDAVIVAASNMQRAYPAMAVEIQDALGIEGYGFDMNVACSSATFGIQQARDMIASGSARCVLMVNPEICSGHLNYRATAIRISSSAMSVPAVIVESAATANSAEQYQIIDTKLQTIYSNNIRNNFGFLNRADESGVGKPDKLFVQEGRKVFKEVCPAVAKQISDQLGGLGIEADALARLWLHQANLNMNQLISKRVLGRGRQPRRIADNSRRIRQYQLRRLGDRLPQIPAGPEAGGPRHIVLLRRRLQHRQRGAQEAVGASCTGAT